MRSKLEIAVVECYEVMNDMRVYHGIEPIRRTKTSTNYIILTVAVLMFLSSVATTYYQ